MSAPHLPTCLVCLLEPNLNMASESPDHETSATLWLAIPIHGASSLLCIDESSLSLPDLLFFSGEWDNACNELQKMLIVRSLRPDRVSFCVTSFIINNLGSKFVEPPVLDMQQVVEDSTTRTPLIFVLSPGVVSWRNRLGYKLTINANSR